MGVRPSGWTPINFLLSAHPLGGLVLNPLMVPGVLFKFVRGVGLNVSEFRAYNKMKFV